MIHPSLRLQLAATAVTALVAAMPARGTDRGPVSAATPASGSPAVTPVRGRADAAMHAAMRSAVKTRAVPVDTRPPPQRPKCDMSGGCLPPPPPGKP